MIARVWKAIATSEHVADYQHHFEQSVSPELKTISFTKKTRGCFLAMPRLRSMHWCRWSGRDEAPVLTLRRELSRSCGGKEMPV